MTVALARLLNPLVWRRTSHTARKLHGFALAEHGSMLDMRLAASATESPIRAAAYLRHADDEARHAQMFARRARRLASESGRILGPVAADTEHLFERLGEVGFLAFVHLGEARALAQFETYLDYFTRTGRERERALFETIMVDERRHSAYSLEFLTELAGGELQARKAIRRAARWELGRKWLRAGRFVAEKFYLVAMLVVYLISAPLSLLVKLARPVVRGWQA